MKTRETETSVFAWVAFLDLAAEVNKLATRNWKWKAAHAEIARLVKEVKA